MNGTNLMLNFNFSLRNRKVQNARRAAIARYERKAQCGIETLTEWAAEARAALATSAYGDFDTQWALVERMARYERAERRIRNILSDLETLN